jgi:hypothetical protein
MAASFPCELHSGFFFIITAINQDVRLPAEKVSDAAGGIEGNEGAGASG